QRIGMPVSGLRLAVGVGGFGWLLLGAQGVADFAPVSASVFRPGFDGLPVDRDGLVRLTLGAQGGGKGGVRSVAVLGIACDGRAVDGEGFVLLPLFTQGTAEVPVDEYRRWTNGHGHGVEPNRPVEVLLVVRLVSVLEVALPVEVAQHVGEPEISWV